MHKRRQAFPSMQHGRLEALSGLLLRVAWARQLGFYAFLLCLDHNKELQRKKEEGSWL